MYVVCMSSIDFICFYFDNVYLLLQIGNNPFDSEGAQVIIEAIDLNECSAIKHLDFSVSKIECETPTGTRLSCVLKWCKMPNK